MSKFAVAVFSEEGMAYEAARALEGLHRDGTVTVFGGVVVQRNEIGALTAGRRRVNLPIPFAVAALVGGLVTLFGGPDERGAIGYAREQPVGRWRDYLHAGVSDGFLTEIFQAFVPGTFALVADIAEDSPAPLDACVRALRGTMIREMREDFVDGVVERVAEVRRSELAALRSTGAAREAWRTSPVLARSLAEAQASLDRAAADLRERLDHAREDLDAQVAAFQEQAAASSADARNRIERRIAALRERFAARERRLERAYELAQSTIRPEVALADEQP